MVTTLLKKLRKFGKPNSRLGTANAPGNQGYEKPTFVAIRGIKKLISS